MTNVIAGSLSILGVALVLVGVVYWSVRRRTLVADSRQASFQVLHTANLASPSLRKGFEAAAFQRAAPAILELVGTRAIAVASATEVLCFAGRSGHHEADVLMIAAETLADGRSHVRELRCERDGCPVRAAVTVPIAVRGTVGGVLIGFDPESSAGLIRSMSEVAAWITSQIELAELDENRVRLARAELRALRAQISPHFIYNALTAIASFTRSDPDRARELLLEFADFTRYSLRSYGEFTTVAEELRSIERYLTLEKARFGDRLDVEVRVAPEVLQVVIPFLVVQPLVENAVRHGIERGTGVGRLTIEAKAESNDCVIVVEDDGVGADPVVLQGCMNGDSEQGDHIGLYNVDERLRSVFGPSYGLVVETAIGAGTRVTVRAPKYRPGVRR